MLLDLEQARRSWDKTRWPNFRPAEMACTCCGEVWWSPADFDAAQKLRRLLNRPVSFNSTHRCWRNNARVGGAPRSEHKKIAFDFSLRRPQIAGTELPGLQSMFHQAGFMTMGLYGTFIHLDRRLGRFWVKPAGKRWLEHFRRN